MGTQFLNDTYFHFVSDPGEPIVHKTRYDTAHFRKKVKKKRILSDDRKYDAKRFILPKRLLH